MIVAALIGGLSVGKAVSGNCGEPLPDVHPYCHDGPWNPNRSPTKWKILTGFYPRSSGPSETRPDEIIRAQISELLLGLKPPYKSSTVLGHQH